MRTIAIPAVLMGAIALAGCTDKRSAERALEAQGFTDIQVGGYSLLGCDQQDTFRTAFKAVGAGGQTVEGVVCSGWFKGATVRVH